jgi:transcriptional regulator with XRE-family HTH domain
MSDLTEAFGERLIVARFRYGRISQEVAAARAGVHRTEMSLLENGLRMPLLETVVRVAGAVEMTAGELLGPIRWVPATKGEPGRFVLCESDAPSPGATL